MALLFDGMKCPLCGGELRVSERMVATTHFIEDEKDPLWTFSDAAMHYECFQRWPLRQQFVSRYNQVMGNGTRHEMLEDGAIVSGTTPPGG